MLMILEGWSFMPLMLAEHCVDKSVGAIEQIGIIDCESAVVMWFELGCKERYN